MSIYVELKDGQGWTQVFLPMKSHSSANAALFNKFKELEEKGKIMVGTMLKIRTWLGTTKKTGRPIRRYVVQVVG